MGADQYLSDRAFFHPFCQLLSGKRHDTSGCKQKKVKFLAATNTLQVPPLLQILLFRQSILGSFRAVEMQQSEFQRQSHHMRAISCAQFQSDIFDMTLYCPGCYCDFLRRLFGRQTLRYQFQNLLFPGSKGRNSALRVDVQHSIILFVIETDATSKTVLQPNCFQFAALDSVLASPGTGAASILPSVVRQIDDNIAPSTDPRRLAYILS